MARRTRCNATFLLAALVAAAVFRMPAFLASPGPNVKASTVTSATAAPLLAASNAVLLASYPEPAHAGGMFDFGLTLPFVALTFLLMMFVLNALWYSPVTTEMDDRNAKLLQTLSEATDMLAKADEIQVAYTEKIRAAREKASQGVAEYRTKTEAAINVKVEQARAASDARAAELRAKLEAEVQTKMAAAEPEIEKRKAAFVKETLASINM
eukprot:CAMPEP_0117484628 /NCGR_PEP_ID=MMETSP0784-20121206/14553_1 /TAXON_ID=39447 /ORGANISM="" /LENGTH=210 /DNA_ID=CAMNT_0005279201 /DNA_START=91 /DNA_END=723 /DNA_ORIENTATION=-